MFLEVMEGLSDSSFWKGKRVFITGNTGFKGSWLSMVLNHLGADVYGYSLQPPTTPSLYSLCRLNLITKTVIGDIRDYGLLLHSIQAAQPEIIFHLAAQPIVRLSYSDPVETYSVNIMGTVLLLEAARHSPGTKVLVNVTSDKCYENKENILGYKESDQLGGHDPYSSSKACSELITNAYRKSFFEKAKYPVVATARAGNVIGGGDWATDRIIPDLLRAISIKQPVVLRFPSAVRPWQHVLEPITGYLLLARKLYTTGSEFATSWNFGPGESNYKSVEWIISQLCRKMDNMITYEVSADQHLMETNYLRLDSSKARKELCWESRWDLEKTLDSIVCFIRCWQDKRDLKKLCIKEIEDYLNK
jgi:CDP-glucose 4,6-dehydratase